MRSPSYPAAAAVARAIRRDAFARDVKAPFECDYHDLFTCGGKALLHTAVDLAICVIGSDARTLVSVRARKYRRPIRLNARAASTIQHDTRHV